MIIRYRKPWTEEKINCLIKNYSNKSCYELSTMLSLSSKQISAKAAQLRLKKTKEYKSKVYSKCNGHRHHPEISDETVRELLKTRKNYQVVSEITGIPITALYCRNCDKWKIPIRPWTPDNLQLLRKLFPIHSDQEIANILGLCVRSISAKARGLGLRKDPAHLASVQQINGINLAKHPRRHRFPKGIKHLHVLSGPAHPRWVDDRAKLRGPRRKQFCFPIPTKKLVRSEQNDSCKQCNSRLYGKGEFDHIRPVCLGGTSEQENCQLLCQQCHIAKTVPEWLVYARQKGYIISLPEGI